MLELPTKALNTVLGDVEELIKTDRESGERIDSEIPDRGFVYSGVGLCYDWQKIKERLECGSQKHLL